MLCLASDVVDKYFGPACKDWRNLKRLDIDPDTEPISTPAESNTATTPASTFNLEEWLEGNSDEYDDDAATGERVPHRNHDPHRQIRVMDQSRAMLYTCAWCGNVSGVLSKCTACGTTKYCDASWCVSFHV